MWTAEKEFCLNPGASTANAHAKQRTPAKCSGILAVLSALVISTSAASAGTFLGPTSTTNKFLVSSGTAAIISSFWNSGAVDVQTLSDASFATLVTDAISAIVPICNTEATPEYAIQGPAELVFTNQVVVCYQTLRTTNIQTVVVGTNTAGAISISDGARAHFFAPFERIATDVQVQKTGYAARTVRVSGEQEFDGPLQISIPKRSYVRVFSFLIAENAVSVPQFRAIQSPIGNYQISIEKSFDLTNWYPVLLKPATSDAKAFYRLSISQ